MKPLLNASFHGGRDFLRHHVDSSLRSGTYNVDAVSLIIMFTITSILERTYLESRMEISRRRRHVLNIVC